MLNRVIAKFRYFDIFGTPIGLNFQQDNLFKTKFGGFFSIFVLAILISCFWRNIMEFVNKENVSVDQQQLFEENPSKFQLNHTNFMFAVKVEQPNFIERPHFSTKFEIFDVQNLQNGQRIKNSIVADLVPCTIDHWKQLPDFDDEWIYNLNKTQIQTFLCPKIDQQYYVGGSFKSDHFHYFRITVSKCQNQTQVNNQQQNTTTTICSTPQELKKFLDVGDIKFQVYLYNVIVNPQKPRNFMESYLDNDLVFFIQPQFLNRKIDIYLSSYSITSDESILPLNELFGDQVEQQYVAFQQNDLREQYRQVSPKDKDYLEVYFRRNKFSSIIERKYQKIDEIISYIGGFAQCFLIASSFIVSCYNEFIYQIELSNQLYDFEIQDRKEKNKEKKQRKSPKISPQKQNSLENNQNQNNEKVQNINKNNQSELVSPVPLEYVRKLVQKRRGQKVQRKQNLKKEDVVTFVNPLFSPTNTYQNIKTQNLLEINSPKRKIIQNIFSLNEINNQQNQQQEKKLELKNSPKADDKQYNEKSKMFINNIKEMEDLNRKQFLTKEFEFIIKRKQQIQFQFKYFLNKLTCGKFFNSKIVRLIDKAYDNISQDLDICNILNRLKEIEKLKELFLDKEQQTLFNFFPKPVIRDHQKFDEQYNQQMLNLSQKFIQSNLKHKKIRLKETTLVVQAAQKLLKAIKKNQNLFSTVDDYQKLYEAYEVVCQKNENEINQKLINFLGNEMKDLFETSKLMKFGRKLTIFSRVSLKQGTDNETNPNQILKTNNFVKSTKELM